MVKILNIIGARPQIIKAAAISRAISTHFADRIEDIILHTGQHYDAGMSQVFFDELGIPEPQINLGVGSGSHGEQTSAMITGIEKAILDRKPDIVLVYGDTNSTLAAAVAASKLHVPVAHIEAGLRSFNKRMPEEINRILCDHASAYLFVPTLQGMKNLLREGFPVGNLPPFSNDHPGVFHCGDVMYDNTLHFAEIAARKSAVMMNHQLNEGGFVLVTIHRDSNTDSQERLQQIVRAVTTLADRTSLIFFVPLHPRTSKMLQSHPDDQFLRVFTHHPRIILSEPVSFLDMTMLEKNAALVITDSGGVQKEAYFFRKPCVILRPQTEWTEIVDAKAAVLADADCDRIIRAGEGFLAQPPIDFPPIFGDGKAAEFICNTLTASVKG